MKRAFAFLLCLYMLLYLLTLSVFAHPGGTDASGGHTDQSTGEYHYHHGYPAHYHTGGRCPYNFDDKTGQNSGSPSNNSNSSGSSNQFSNNSSSDSIDASDIIAYIGLGIIALFCLYVFVGVIIDKIKDWFSKEETAKSAPSPQHLKEPKHFSVPPSTHMSGLENDQPTSSRSASATPHPKSTQTPRTPPHPKSIPQVSQPISQAAPPPAPMPRALPFASGIRAEHPIILSADPDYLTEAQVLAYALSLETPRGKKAVTEQFIIKGNLTTNKSNKPFQVSADVLSLGSAQYYHTTLVRCTCPDHRARHLPCKHMIALAINVNAITVDIEALQKREERS